MAYNEIDTNDMEIWKKSCLKTIYRWEELYDDYKYYETILIENINNIIDIKEEIKNTPKFIDKDDNDFNLALIENSLYFLIKSLKVNRIKFLEDYNKLCFKSLIMYLQLGKKLRCSINKIIESIGYPI